MIASLPTDPKISDDDAKNRRPSQPRTSVADTYSVVKDTNDSGNAKDGPNSVVLCTPDLTEQSDLQEEAVTNKRKADDFEANRATKKKPPPPPEAYDVVIVNYARRCEKCNLTIVKGRTALQSKRQWRKFRHLDCNIHEYNERSELGEEAKQMKYRAKTVAVPEVLGSADDQESVHGITSYPDHVESLDRPPNREAVMRTSNPSNLFWPGYNVNPSPRGNVPMTDIAHPSLPAYLPHRNGPWTSSDDAVEFERGRFYSDSYATALLPPRYRQAPRELDIQETARSGEPYDRLGYESIRKRS